MNIEKLSFLSVLILMCFFGLAQTKDHTLNENYEKKHFAAKMNFEASSETNNYDIIYHRILWEVDPAIYFIKGEITSYFKATQDNVSSIYFDLINELTVESVKQNGASLTYTHTNNLLKIDLKDPINNGRLDSVTIKYNGVPQSLTDGFGSFETNEHNGTPILWTLSEPYGAREWWPCKQSLNDKIDSIDIYVKTPSEYKVGSNGALIYEKISSGKKLTYWKHRYPIASYLVAIAVTNYESYSHYAEVEADRFVKILNYVYPEDKNWAEKSTEFTVKVMELFSELFIPYPFSKEKYGHAQFGWNGGMEHQTMSFMGGFSEKLITHELSHQWFGDHVTCGSWQDIWINEGFAVFCENVAQEHIYPESWIDWKRDRMEYVLKNARSGSVFCTDTSSVDRIFNGALTYQKGGLIIQLLRSQIGDEAFFKGIKNMLTNSNTSGGFASASDVQLFMEESADTSLTAFFNDWYYGEGYPEYYINWYQDLDLKVNIEISQITTHTSVPFYKLKVPILLRNANRDSLFTLTNSENIQTFVLNSDFIVDEIVFDPNYNIIAPHPAYINIGIEETMPQNSISIYPNPGKEQISIHGLNETTIEKYDIIDSSGKHILYAVQPQDTKNIELDISTIKNGVYYIRIKTNEGTVVKKFVKAS